MRQMIDQMSTESNAVRPGHRETGEQHICRHSLSFEVAVVPVTPGKDVRRPCTAVGPLKEGISRARPEWKGRVPVHRPDSEPHEEKKHQGRCIQKQWRCF